ncbi:MAG: glycerophosphodiester phosphodiesterase family protein [Eubacterium sp.]|nr:glycerophosphodiester phosphodiesterase family protein [Eubacterium sp.]
MSDVGKKVFKALFGTAAVWAVAVKPRLLHKADLTVFRRYDYAHRGLHNEELGIPENSLEAFERAAAKGYGVTADVLLSKDGMPAVFSEGKTTPLKEVLKAVDGRVPILLNLHVRKGNYARLCEAVAEKLDLYDGLFAIESIDPRVLFWYRRQRDEYIRVQMVDYAHMAGRSRTGRIWDFLCSSLLFNVFAAPDAISESVDCHYAPGTLLCRILYHVPTMDWTVRTEEDYEKIKTDGSIVIFDGIEP